MLVKKSITFSTIWSRSVKSNVSLLDQLSAPEEVPPLPIKQVEKKNGEPALEIPHVEESSTDHSPRQPEQDKGKKEEEEEEESPAKEEDEIVVVEKPNLNAASDVVKTPTLTVEQKTDMYKEAADDLLDDLGDISSDEEEEGKVELFEPTAEIPIIPLKKEDTPQRRGGDKPRAASTLSALSTQSVPPLPAALERNIKIVKKVRA